MPSYKLLMIAGVIISVIGFISMYSITVYYYDTTRTITEIGIKLAILFAGVLVYRKGVSMRDDR